MSPKHLATIENAD